MEIIEVNPVIYLLRDNDVWLRMVADAGGEPFAGVYRLHRLSLSGRPLPMPRLLDIDPQGVLYLGTSFHVPNRVSLVKRGLSAAYKNLDPATYQHLPYIDPYVHQTGKKVMRIGSEFCKKIPFDELGVSVVRYVAEKPVQEGETDYGHFAQEEELLRAYEAVHGERPALNG